MGYGRWGGPDTGGGRLNTRYGRRGGKKDERREETQDHRGGASTFAPPHTPTPKPSTTSRIGNGGGGASLHMGRWVGKLGEDIGRPESEGW